ncbi:hypothetical protein VU07_02140, partial [Desulfobulbus sp. F4]|nr:hypothetical protein [Desulfobulbus sp. F4]
MFLSANNILLELVAVAAALCLPAKLSAHCVLRTKKIPPDSVKTVSRILFAAFFVIYLFAGSVLSFADFTPQAAEFIRSLLSQPTLPVPPVALPNSEVPKGRIAAEQNRAERQLFIAETERLQIKAADDRRNIFGAKQPYIVSEGISGTEDRYMPKNNEISPSHAETKISVQEIVSSSGDLSSILTGSRSQLVQEPPAKQSAAMPVPTEQETAAAITLPPPEPIPQEEARQQEVQSQHIVKKEAIQDFHPV